MRLKVALDIKPGEVISLVGGGGKTTLMFALARELTSDNSCVLTTTTTKIFKPLPSQTPFLLLEADEEKMVKTLVQNIDRYRHITLARERLPSGKLEGISPDLVVRLASLERVSYIIVEADGANRRSLKAPNPTEPVIPDNTSLLIPVVGVDAVGCLLTEENVFRSEIVSELIGLPPGEVISAESIAFLITHHQGIIKGSPDGARIIPFINKVDLDKGLSRGRDLADEILAVKHPRIERVILGQVQSPEPVVEVIQGGFHG
jgi:probable selenium-dependent hydroxylase accessory protein YqeC